MEFLFLRRIYGRQDEGGFQILLTYSFILIIDDMVKYIWGPEYKTIEKPELLIDQIQFSSIFIPKYNLFILLVGLVIVISFWFLLNKTETGKIVKATAIDRDMLGLLGINVPLVMTIVFGVATA
ncbi:MAG: branched-chain amino acid ABC transporter permease, partial [Candidatus Omnitrophica bacterium]|nr:branched-chain amino acid ABC transporter permease [Candidatus Omnitrophota bacterium]